jgi:hypothetical protein
MRIPKVYLETTMFNYYFDIDRDAHAVTVKPAVTYKRTTKEDRIPPKGHENPQRGN